MLRLQGTMYKIPTSLATSAYALETPSQVRVNLVKLHLVEPLKSPRQLSIAVDITQTLMHK